MPQVAVRRVRPRRPRRLRLPLRLPRWVVVAIALIGAGVVAAAVLAPRPARPPAPVTDRYLDRAASSITDLAARIIARATAEYIAPPTSPPIYADALVWAATTEKNVLLDDYAGAFMSYFIRLYPYVHNTGDLTAWEAHSGPDCDFCRSVAEGVRADQASGMTSENGPIDVTYTRVMGLLDDEYYVVQLITEEASVVRDATGAVVAAADRTVSLVTSRVIREDGTWRVVGVMATGVQGLPATGDARAQDVPVSPTDPVDASLDGAAGTAVQYALLHAHAVATADVGPLQAATDPACRGCADLVAAAGAVPASQRPGDGTVVVDAVWYSNAGGRVPCYWFEVGLVIDDGDSPPVSWIYNMYVTNEGGGWYVEAVDGRSYVERLWRDDPVSIPPRDPDPDWVPL